MNVKEIFVLIIFLFFILPGLIHFIIFTVKAPTATLEENAEEGTKIIAEQSIPWWVAIIEFFSKLPSALAAFLIIGLIFFLRWIGDI